MKQVGFVDLSQDELMQVDGGGLFEDIGYGIGYGARAAYEGVKKAATTFLNPFNYINMNGPVINPKKLGY